MILIKTFLKLDSKSRQKSKEVQNECVIMVLWKNKWSRQASTEKSVVAFFMPKIGGEAVPKKPKRPCSYPGCPELTDERYCKKHKQETEKTYGKSCRPYSHLYNSSRWRKLRRQFLIKHPLCAECRRLGVINPSRVVDHIKPHQGDESLFWDETNLQALCKSCHDRKTAKEDGRWGRKGEVYSYNFRDK